MRRYSLWYVEEINRFQNEFGDIIHDVSEFLDPYTVMNWKRSRTSCILEDRQGNLVKLFFVPATECNNFEEEDDPHLVVYSMFRDWNSEGRYIYERR